MAGAKKNTTNKTVEKKDDNVELENKKLKEQLEQMQKMLEEMKNAPKEVETVEVVKEVIVEKENEENIDIPLNRGIKVISLFNGGMTLKTSDNSRMFRFNKMGDMQIIMYADLVQIMANQDRFCREGYFMILDKNVVKVHGLTEVYEKLLDVKQIKSILEYDDDKIKALVKGTTKNIKESIIAVVVSQINDNTVDKNKVYVLNEVLDMDLFAYARGDVETLVNNRNK
jgi:hypothetical protein